MQNIRVKSFRWQYWAWQLLVLAGLLSIIGVFARNVATNLTQRGIASGFAFLGQAAGFDLAFHLLPYDSSATFAWMFVLAFLNTLLVAFLGIILSSVIGLAVALARLSRNPLLKLLASTYVEVLRNVPLLLQLFFWYFAVLRNLPSPRQSLNLGGWIFLNNRGLVIPFPEEGLGVVALLGAVFVGLLLCFLLRHRARQLREKQGTYPAWNYWGYLLPAAVPLLFFLSFGQTWAFVRPQLEGFNFVGGLQLIPEFVSLVLALSLYTAAFISEIIRAGVLSVAAGQLEAVHGLGFSRWDGLRLVILPQALRVILPPLTSQYLNLTKNSSLAAAIAFPDLVLVFAGTALNVTGQALELMGMTMLVYLSLSLAISYLMNRYQAKTQHYQAQGAA